MKTFLRTLKIMLLVGSIGTIGYAAGTAVIDNPGDGGGGGGCNGGRTVCLTGEGTVAGCTGC